MNADTPFRKTRIAQAVAMSLAVFASAPVHAIGVCTTVGNGVTSTITTSVSGGGGTAGVCLSSGASVQVTGPGGVISTADSGVIVTATSPPVAGSITNSGSISGTSFGVNIETGKTTTGITNSGTISGGKASIYNAGTIGGITNSGVLDAGIVNTGNITGGITNTGTIGGAISLGNATINFNGASGQANGTITGGTGSIININGTLDRTVATSWSGFYAETMNINSGGRLGISGGGGTVIGSSGAINNSGTLAVAAGNTASIYGTYTQSAAGIIEIGVASNTSYGKVQGLGSATSLPENAKISVNVVGSPALTSGTVLTNAIQHPYAGTFTTSTFSVTDNSALFDFTAARVDNAVNLTIVAANASPTLEALKRTGNTAGQGAAAALDRLFVSPGAMADIITRLGTFTTDKQVSDFLSQVLPLMVTGVKQVGFTSLRNVDKVVQSRVDSLHGLSSGDEFYGNKQFWFKPMGAWADQDDLKGVSGYKTRSAGAVFGADHVISDKVRAGAAFSITNTRMDSKSTVAPNSARVDSYRLIGYASYNLDSSTDVNFQADIGTNKTAGNRQIAGIGTAESNYGSWNTHVGAGWGRNIKVSEKTSIAPSVRLDYTYMEDKAYTETGVGALNLVVAKSKADELVLYGEGKVTHDLSGDTKLVGNLGAGYDFNAKQSSITAAFAGGGGQFITKGLDIAPWSVRGGLGVVSNSKTMEVTARYDVEFRERSNNQTVSVKFRMPF